MFIHLQSLPLFATSFISITSVFINFDFHENRHSESHALLKGTNILFFIFPIILPLWLKFRTRGLHTTPLNTASFVKIGVVKGIVKEINEVLLVFYIYIFFF